MPKDRAGTDAVGSEDVLDGDLADLSDVEEDPDAEGEDVVAVDSLLFQEDDAPADEDGEDVPDEASETVLDGEDEDEGAAAGAIPATVIAVVGFDDDVLVAEVDDEVEPAVLPQQRDEFMCSTCFLVKHVSQRDGQRCRDCA